MHARFNFSDIEGGQAVAGDDQQSVDVDGVDVTDFAATEQRQTLDG